MVHQDRLNLEAEALAQLTATVSPDEDQEYKEGAPDAEARLAAPRAPAPAVCRRHARKKAGRHLERRPGGDLQPALPLLRCSGIWPVGTRNVATSFHRSMGIRHSQDPGLVREPNLHELATISGSTNPVTNNGIDVIFNDTGRVSLGGLRAALFLYDQKPKMSVK
jgi:hypothetical protein